MLMYHFVLVNACELLRPFVLNVRVFADDFGNTMRATGRRPGAGDYQADVSRLGQPRQDWGAITSVGGVQQQD